MAQRQHIKAKQIEQMKKEWTEERVREREQNIYNEL